MNSYIVLTQTDKNEPNSLTVPLTLERAMNFLTDTANLRGNNYDVKPEFSGENEDLKATITVPTSTVKFWIEEVIYA
jgi:hypothetical protein